VNGQSLRNLVEEHGHEEVVRRLVPLFWTSNPAERIPVNAFSLREAWEALIGPCGQTLAIASALGRGGFHRSPVIEAAQSTAFSILTGNVIAAAVQQAYDALPSTLDQLVTPVPSKMRTERFAGIQAIGGVKDVPEGQDYPEAGTSDKGTQGPEPSKRGFIFPITEETVFFDQTGQVLVRGRTCGRAMRDDREAAGMYAIQDASGYESYYPIVGGDTPTQTALYRSVAGGTAYYHRTVNVATTNALVDWTDVDAALLVAYAMTDEAGDPITWVARQMLVPRALLATALRVVGATQLQAMSGTDQTAPWTANVTVSPNVVALLQQSGGAIIPLSSPFMSCATTWYVGDFPAQFYEQEIFPIQTVELPPDQRRDTITAFRVRRKSRVYATDDKFVIKNTA
jgi:hypothetical protein